MKYLAASPLLTAKQEQSLNTQKLVAALSEPGQFGHAVSHIEVIETHISYVLLTGLFVYKIKKPVDLGFVDFSTLEKRKFYCNEEVRLNKRTASDLYLGVVSITGSCDRPELDGKGEAIEYAVKMRQFDQNHQLDRYLKQRELSSAQIDEFAADIADFHASLVPAGWDSEFATYESVTQQVLDNFAFCAPCTKSIGLRDALQAIEGWTQESLRNNQARFEQRKRDGFVRECHGDLHLGNLTLLNNRIVAFDCLEFNADLRWIDTISEIAFFLMDLAYHQRSRQGRLFLNKYLEASGDYAGLYLLRHYLTYRAMVRAKVACIKLQQISDSKHSMKTVQAGFERHVALAKHYTKPAGNTPIIITHGLSGCGKTFISERLLQSADMIRVRSDIERKRLAGLSGQADSHSETGEGLYSKDINRAVYGRLLVLARKIVAAGYPVLVDATFLQSGDRQMFRKLAEELNTSYVILNIQASPETLRRRIKQRLESKSDASEATLDVLKYQQEYAEPLSMEERHHCVPIDSEGAFDPDSIWKNIQAIRL